ncbi:MAG: mannitol dehydrogenase family protein [Defluviitaleaceae bacterium]|nr:mannitol dehydrogenase family protein [Defluviitaleaceae bacterium]MCL2264075.1 mannitol dehydrogenase family protein [Defluviitaleaceae bacterium]
MKLKLDNLNRPDEWNSDYKLPTFDVAGMRERTAAAPEWLHIGAGNIFRIFVASAQQDLLEYGETNTGIIVYEAYDEEIIPTSFAPYDNLTLGVTLTSDGSTKKRVIASVADAFSNDLERVAQVIAAPTLQMISLTITEKGYSVAPDTICKDPTQAKTALEQVALGLFSRFEAGAKPIALVSMDNFAENGTQLSKAIAAIADTWLNAGTVDDGFTEYVKSLKFPWTMIDNITPRPSPDVAKILAAEGFEDTEITETTKHTFVAPFVNAETARYLVIEDDFPAGRPPLERAGVYMTDRETVRKVDQMKVCACLNPLHSILAITGMLLNYPTISDCMKDARLVKLIRTAAVEALPVVPHPGIIDPIDFLNEVLTKRFPNPFIPDAPARIASDTSQKIPVRFGVTLKEREAKGLPAEKLKAIPLFFALWLRYRMAMDDNGDKLNLSPDPSVPADLNILYSLPFGKSVDLRLILSNKKLFGVNLYDAGIGDRVEDIFERLSAGADAVSNELTDF